MLKHDADPNINGGNIFLYTLTADLNNFEVFSALGINTPCGRVVGGITNSDMRNKVHDTLATLLIDSIMNNNHKKIDKLLKLGADINWVIKSPNAPEEYSKLAPLTVAIKMKGEKFASQLVKSYFKYRNEYASSILFDTRLIGILEEDYTRNK